VRYSYQASVVLTITLLISISMVLAAINNSMIYGNLFSPLVNGQLNPNENLGNLRHAMLPQVVQISNGTTFHLTVAKVDFLAYKL